MSIKDIITRGFGVFSDVKFIPTMGFASLILEKCNIDITTTMTPSETDVTARMTDVVDVTTRMGENIDITTTMAPSATDVTARMTDVVDITTSLCRP